MTNREPAGGREPEPFREGDPTAELGVFDQEWQASLVRETLLSAGIPSVVAGGFTGSFRAEAPGRVKVLVRAADMERAVEALRKRREEAASIDWSKVDVSEGEEPASPS